MSGQEQISAVGLTGVAAFAIVSGMYRLVYQTGRLKGRRIVVQQGAIVIGRDPECQIDLVDDDEVSRKHAVIEQRTDGVYVKDLGATNTVQVNGKPIKEALLKHRDRIEIGRTVFEYQPIDPPLLTGRRRISRVQVVTFMAIFVIILIEVLFVFLFPAWHEGALTSPVIPSVKQIASKPSPVVTKQPAPTISLEEELKQATAKLEPSEPVTPAPVTNVPIATPAATESTQVVQEVQELKTEVADIKQQMTDLAPTTEVAVVTQEVVAATQQVVAVTQEVVAATQQVATVTQEVAAVTQEVAVVEAEPPPPQENLVDPLTERATQMMKEAQAEEAKLNLVKADNMYERIQVMAPEFLPSYVERARLYEKRGMLKKSGEQWTQVLNQSMGTPLYEQAAAERQRLARAEIVLATTKGPEKENETTAANLPRRIRIVSVDREKFQSSKDYDEMRLLHITLKPLTSEGHIDGDDVRVVVTFYEKVENTDTVLPSRASTPQDGLAIEGVWVSGEKRTVTAAYILPKGFRSDEEDTYNEKRNYEGYRVQVFFKNELQDDSAMPKSLLALAVPEQEETPDVSKPLRRR